MWRVIIGLVMCSRLRVECSPYFVLTLRVWFLSHLLAATTKLSRVLSQASRLLPYVHASSRGELLIDGSWGLGLGVGAPCLGGGHPSLTPTYSQVWALSYVLSQLGLGFGFRVPSLFV